MVGGRGRKVASTLALAMALALSTACSGGPYGRDTTAASSTSGAGATSSSAPGPARIVGGKEDGFTIQIPAGWTDIRIDQATLQRLFDKKQSFDEGVANQIRILAGRNGKLLAYEDAHRTTNLNVLKVPATPGTTTESLVKDLPGQLTQLGLKDVVVERITLPGGPAARASGTKPAAGSGGPPKDLFQLQYYAVSGSDTFICVLASDEPGRDRAQLEAIGQTFTLVH
jgi:hypothetical protein